MQSSAEFALSLWKYLRIYWEIKSCQGQNKENQSLSVLHFCHSWNVYNTISCLNLTHWHIHQTFLFFFRNLKGLNGDCVKNMTAVGKRKFFLLPESEIGRHQIKLQLHSVASYKGERWPRLWKAAAAENSFQIISQSLQKCITENTFSSDQN